MADWVVCPGCQLRHSRRADGLCPRCRKAVGGGASPARAATVAPPPAPVSPVPLAVPPPPALPPLTPTGPPAPAPTEAGPLDPAGSARGKGLRNARAIMLVIGGLAVAANGYYFASAERDVQAQIDREIRELPSGFVADPVKVAAIKGRAVRANRLNSAGGLVLGLLFLGCAALVTRHPVPVTITSLVAYVGGNAAFGFIDPTTVLSGLVIKVVIVVGLAKAVHAAIAHRMEAADASGR